MKKFIKNAVIPFAIITSIVSSFSSVYALDYTVKSGDSLYTISRSYNVDTDTIKALNGMNTTNIYPGQLLKVSLDYVTYTVKTGDSLWIIAQRFGITMDSIRLMNKLTSDTLNLGQQLKLDPKLGYVVKNGDTLAEIAVSKNISVQEIKMANGLFNDIIYYGQVLLIPKVAAITPTPTTIPTTTKQVQLQPVATVYYTVQAGDSVSTIAQKFKMSSDNLIKYNYMSINDWFSAGQKIAVNGYAPRNYTVTPGESIAPAKQGKLVDWFKEGQYLLRRGDIFTIVDVETGAQFKVKMLGGYNHSDIETLTAADTAVMYKLFNSKWTWSPRAIVVYKDGMNIAASLSGMPHSFDTIAGNNMAGHCDVYLKNSIPHSVDTSSAYIQEHYKMLYKAAGLQYLGQ